MIVMCEHYTHVCYVLYLNFDVRVLTIFILFLTRSVHHLEKHGVQILLKYVCRVNYRGWFERASLNLFSLMF